MFRLQLSSIFATLLFLAPAFGQWQEIGNEQIPDNLRVEGVQAIDADGLRLSDDGDTLGIFLKDGGNIGIGTSNPNHQLDLRTLTGLDTTAGSQNDLLALWGHGNRSDRVVFFTERFSTAGSTSDWTTVHHRWQRIVDSVEMGFIGFGRASGNTYAIQLGYGDDIFLALTDSGNLAIEGELDASGGGEFGDSTHTRSYYQSACALQANTQATYNHLTDTLNPATTGSEVFVSAHPGDLQSPDRYPQPGNHGIRGLRFRTVPVGSPGHADQIGEVRCVCQHLGRLCQLRGQTPVRISSGNHHRHSGIRRGRLHPVLRAYPNQRRLLPAHRDLQSHHRRRRKGLGDCAALCGFNR